MLHSLSLLPGPKYQKKKKTLPTCGPLGMPVLTLAWDLHYTPTSALHSNSLYYLSKTTPPPQLAICYKIIRGLTTPRSPPHSLTYEIHHVPGGQFRQLTACQIENEQWAYFCPLPAYLPAQFSLLSSPKMCHLRCLQLFLKEHYKVVRKAATLQSNKHFTSV
jgi:hypothetical protein